MVLLGLAATSFILALLLKPAGFSVSQGLD